MAISLHGNVYGKIKIDGKRSCESRDSCDDRMHVC